MAFIALSRLDEDAAYEFALENLDCPFVGLRKVMVAFLSLERKQEVVDKAMTLYQDGDIVLRKSMLKLLNGMGGWKVISGLMLGTIDENENIRNLSIEYIKKWKWRMRNLFINPSESELDKAKQAFQFAFSLHEEKQYFKENPLVGLDFYFQ